MRWEAQLAKCGKTLCRRLVCADVWWHQSFASGGTKLVVTSAGLTMQRGSETGEWKYTSKLKSMSMALRWAARLRSYASLMLQADGCGSECLTCGFDLQHTEQVEHHHFA